MKTLKTFLFVIIVILLFQPAKGFTQNTESKDALNKKVMNVAREIMTSASTCALITLDQEGRPRVRAMDAFHPESDFTVWFGTNPKSRKVDQIKIDPRVTLYYLDSKATGYVMLHGVAKLVDDKKEKETRWKDEWEAFYPNKPNDYLLIKVSPQWIEVVSYTHGILGDTVTWAPPVVQFDLK